MNLAILIGGLPRDPELSYTANTQTAVCRFTVAVDRPKRNGEDAGTDYIRVVVWGRQAENCDRYLSKGSKVAVQGRIETGSYTNREGQKVYTTEVIANNVEFLSSRSSVQGGQGASRNTFTGGFDSPSMPQAVAGDAQISQDTQDAAFSAPQNDLPGFDDMPDSFQAAEDDIPF